MTSSSAPPSSPSARKMAEEHGIDLNAIEGTGPDGKITRANVEDAIAANPTASTTTKAEAAPQPPPEPSGDTVPASPLARRIAEDKGIDLTLVQGSGPGGKIVKSDIETFDPATASQKNAAPEQDTSPATKAETSSQDATDRGHSDLDPPYETQKLNNVRKVIARRLTEAKQTIPHIYLTVDVRLDQLLDLRKQLNSSLSADGVKLSVNDLLIKALARALHRVPSCNVSFQGEELHQYSRSDISVAVAAPSGLITPIIRDAGNKGVAQISTEMKELAGKARDGKLQPHEFQGGTASLSNLGMFGTEQFDAVINPPQGMILAIGSGEERPWVENGQIVAATVMSATGSFDHRAIDGADGAQLMKAFKQLCEKPIGMVA